MTRLQFGFIIVAVVIATLYLFPRKCVTDGEKLKSGVNK